jgi:fibronectin-binding autotransporter adhesin
VNIYNNNTTAANTLSINTDLLVNSTGGTKEIRLGGVNTGANTFAGLIGDANGTVISIRKQGTGNWAIGNAANAFTGAITLDSTTTSAGTLAYASAGGANPITFLQTTGSATLSYTGSTAQTMSGPITANALTSGTITLDSSGLGTVNYTNTGSLGSAASGIRKLVLSGSSTGNNTLAGQWADNTGAAATVTKNGAGTWVLSNANTYTGATVVNEGTLLVTNTTGSATGNGAGATVSVASGATLGGTGIITGPVNVTGSIAPGLATGTVIGTLKTGATTWNGVATAASATDWKFNLGASGTEDLLQITGDFTKDTTAGTNFRFDFLNSAVAGTFDLITWTGSTNFNASDFTPFNLGTGYTGTFTISGGNTLQFMSAIPEPSSALAGLLLAAGLFRRKRK